MPTNIYSILLLVSILSFSSCQNTSVNNKPASEIFGNPNYQALAYGGYRTKTRDVVPSMEQFKEDLRILSALDVKILRTYHTSMFAHTERLLQAIRQMKIEDEQFEMYVMLGAWLQCKDAWTENPIHSEEDVVLNTREIETAIELANKYPDIVKVIAAGNEAMVHWATGYWVQPDYILKWVNYLQDKKINGELPKGIWITSSDNFASWGGGGYEYQLPILDELIRAVDYVSLHTYPFHDTHYNPQFWLVDDDKDSLSTEERINSLMQEALSYAKSQYESTKAYVQRVDSGKPVHIGETGWSTLSSGFYGDNGSMAADEYKEALYFKGIRKWTNDASITCVYFEAFDEPWKDGKDVNGSENHFGLISVDGELKYALWNQMNKVKGLKRDGNPLRTSFEGNKDSLMKSVKAPIVIIEVLEDDELVTAR